LFVTWPLGLPAMVLPRWLKSRSEPVGVDDVIVVLATGARLPLTGSASFDLPGPEAPTYQEVLAVDLVSGGSRSWTS
jgi:hypothetical protein